MIKQGYVSLVRFWKTCVITHRRTHTHAVVVSYLKKRRKRNKNSNKRYMERRSASVLVLRWVGTWKNGFLKRTAAACAASDNRAERRATTFPSTRRASSWWWTLHASLFFLRSPYHQTTALFCFKLIFSYPVHREIRWFWLVFNWLY